MTLSQLDYIVAVDTYRHFATAAEACHVTQPTLSMQIQKLEDELGVLVFDRSKQPVVPTETGQALLAQARDVLRAARRIPEIVSESKNDFQGDLRIGIIPTLAPYLLPYFIGEFIQTYPAVSVQIQELVTEQIVDRLRHGLIDVGLVVTPLTENGITEIPLFQEPFVVYAADSHELLAKAAVTAADLQTDGLWLLTDGHCFRNQVINLCGADRMASGSTMLQQPAGTAIESPEKPRPVRLRYETGSLETLIKLIDKQDGFTLLPYLATVDMTDQRRARLRPFDQSPGAAPQPVREVSLVIHRSFLKRKLINALKNEILSHLPGDLAQAKTSSRVVGW
ncbi:hydrogen peroxide-inducible genes activator [Spirosoma utsteinense]|uniref:LysR family hydrogen peroxide-inducible transcriptional activator n=1 Tax=Spirosoma utsteinense TaxID=2585773 RepID=A0ABR6WCY7_9BACT|nr:hydrogen peroxide-inducible genes activator [Spirosoma utsteinense]MBC3786783.1 LysR family hydrogen peroxide-inducible transcriptional activator [Spirosoma utsteinense]MBC3793796.1 LysR family hydrogen peroxide-inducible transcriptional activator [Spirosoma utsteinense]